MRIIDLRSDTVTRPTEGMRRAMYEAEVGDDVFGDDPTTNMLEELVADLLGKEGSLFFPSGTMSNQTAVALHTRPGDELICEAGAHIHRYEGGAPAALSGVTVHAVPGTRGVLYSDQVRLLLKDASDGHEPRTALVCLENTHNRAGGRIFPLEVMRNVGLMAREYGIPVHLDGARLMNAAVATGIPPAEYAACADTVNICLSKGLGAPIGSLLAGTREAIREARRIRKRLGGGMRQVGVIAAAGIYAIRHNVDRLAEDHANARHLADGLAGLPGLEIRPEDVETNILVLRVTHARLNSVELVEVLKTFGVLIVPFGRGLVRAVTHLGVGRDDVDAALDAFQKAVG